MKNLTNLEILETLSINHKKLKEDKPLLFHNILKAMDKAKSQAINYTHCCTQLLCVDKGDDNAITKGYSYECIEEDNTFYKIVDNYGDENWFLKEYFKKQ